MMVDGKTSSKPLCGGKLVNRKLWYGPQGQHWEVYSKKGPIGHVVVHLSMRGARNSMATRGTPK